MRPDPEPLWDPYELDEDPNFIPDTAPFQSYPEDRQDLDQLTKEDPWSLEDPPNTLASRRFNRVPRRGMNHPLTREVNNGSTEPETFRGPMMARKRLTAATLDDNQRETVGTQAFNLISKLLGPAASDQEIVAGGRLLYNRLGGKGIAALHRLASRIAAESGEDFAAAQDDDSKIDPRDTQKFVAEHELTPDHSVLDVALHERNPTQNPTAADKKSKSGKNPREEDEVDEDEDEDARLADFDPDTDNGINLGESDSLLETDFADEFDPTLDDTDDDENIDDNMGNADETLEVMQDKKDADENQKKEEAKTEEKAKKEPDEEDSGDEDKDEGDEDDFEDTDDDEFTMDDMEELERMGVDGVLTHKNKDRRKSSKNRGRVAEKKPSFRPSRTRLAAVEDDNVFDQIFDAHDVSSHFKD